MSVSTDSDKNSNKLGSIMEKLTIVIPTLNEQEGIGKTIDELLELGINKNQIIVIDGYSTDKTVEIAKSKGVKVIFQEGKGKADAIITAIKRVNTDYMLVMDGDYTYDPSKIPKMLSLMDGYAEVIGARVEGRENIPIINRFGNKILTWLFNTIFGTSLRDVLSGMYMVKTELIKGILGKTRGFSIEAEIAAHMSLEGDITDIPIRYRKRLGKAKLTILDGIKIGLSMIKLSWTYNPLLFIFTLGAITLIPGIALGLYIVYDYIFNSVLHRTLTIITVLLIITGLISAFFAILILFLKRMELRIIRKIEHTGK